MLDAVLHQRIVRAHELNVLAVALAARVGDRDAVEGRCLRGGVVESAKSMQTIKFQIAFFSNADLMIAADWRYAIWAEGVRMRVTWWEQTRRHCGELDAQGQTDRKLTTLPSLIPK